MRIGPIIILSATPNEEQTPIKLFSIGLTTCLRNVFNYLGHAISHELHQNQLFPGVQHLSSKGTSINHVDSFLGIYNPQPSSWVLNLIIKALYSKVLIWISPYIYLRGLWIPLKVVRYIPCISCSISRIRATTYRFNW